MVIYAEFLFLENAVTGLFILILTGKLCGLKSRKALLAAGSVLCGLYAFVLFVEMAALAAMALKVLFSLVVVTLAFPVRTWRLIAKTTLVFYIVSFAMGGITIGAMYFFRIRGVAGNTAVYLEKVTYMQVAIGVLLTYAAISVMAAYLKEKRLAAMTSVELEITIGVRKESFMGMIDTGNFLTVPVTGEPVVLAAREVLEKLLPEDVWDELAGPVSKLSEKTMERGRVRLVPFRSVGAETGLLPAVKTDKIDFWDRREQRLAGSAEGVYLGIYNGSFPRGWNDETFQVLVHPKVMENGIYHRNEERS